MNRIMVLVYLVICTFVYAHEPNEFKPTENTVQNISPKVGIKGGKHYKSIVLAGNNHIILNTIEKYSIAAFEILPLSGVSGGGLSVGYVNTYSYSSKEELVYFQPSFVLAPKYVAFRFGFTVYTEITPTEGPGGIILPHGELKIGNLQKFYICGSALTDLFWGIGMAGFVYEFDDQASNVMLGCAFGDNWDYTGYTCNFDIKLSSWFFSRLKGSANFHKHLYGFQAGIGILL